MVGVEYCIQKTMHSPTPLLLPVAERTLGPDFVKAKKVTFSLITCTQSGTGF
jgi:hypothetical protein